MSKHLGRNAIYAGSFNPVHIGHIKAMEYMLERFDYLHVFVRYTEGVELTDWKTKEGFFRQIVKDMNMENRIHIYKVVPEAKGKTYSVRNFFDFMKEAEKIIGETADGYFFGEEYATLKSEFEKEFPDKLFLFYPRFGDYNSTAIREDIESHKDWLKPYVYEVLRKIKG